MKTVTSRDNPVFKALRGLAADPRRQRERQQTVLDGPHLVSVYRERVGPPELLVVSESGSELAEIRDIVARHDGVDTIVLRDSLFKELSGVANPVGILALVPIPAAPDHPIRGSCLLLDAVQDAGNIGTLLRTAAAAGIEEVALGPGCAGAWTPRVLRAGQGAHFGLAIREQADLAQIVADYPGTVVATVAHGGQSLYAIDLTGSVAWLFGNEGAGLPKALADLAAVKARIPMADGCESMNVAAAAAVCLFEAVRQSLAKKGNRK